MPILPVGGRIKAASVGLDHLFSPGEDVDDHIARLRQNPSPELSAAFFPRTGHELARMLKGVGFFRPSLKTDQGMGGNFLPFFINPTIATTDLSVRTISHEEGAVVPEAWSEEAHAALRPVEVPFRRLDLSGTYRTLEGLTTRRAEKGRFPFFFIRPAMPDRPIVLGRDILEKVEEAVKIALNHMGFTRNLIYCQPDVFILRDGSVAVERINCPDVGLFFSHFDTTGSQVLPQVRAIVEKLRDAVADRIVDMMGERIFIVTRDDVLACKGDVLECREIEALARALLDRGVTVTVVGASDVGSLPHGSRLLLLNLDWQNNAASLKILLRRRNRGDVECFPDPYLQMTSERWTGLPEMEIATDNPHRQTFLQLAGSLPSNKEGASDVRRRIGQLLDREGITAEIIHAQLASETVPIFRRSLHSWRHFAVRAARPGNADGAIRLRSIPARPDNLLLTSTTGPRLHAFRFMWVA